MKFLPLLLILVVSIFALDSKTLHVSAWPSGTEIYINQSNPDFSKNPDYVTPAHIPLNAETTTLLLTFLKPEFKDSVLEVKIPDLKDSYLMVILDKEQDREKIYHHESALAKRHKSKIGKRIMLSSIVPFGIAGFTLLKNYLENEEAKKIRNEIKTHKIQTQKTESLKQDFDSHKESAKNYQKATYWCSSIGLALLGIGFYLQF